MAADVTCIWDNPYGGRIRIPGPGEELPEPAAVIILPVVHRTLHVKPKPPRRPK